MRQTMLKYHSLLILAIYLKSGLADQITNLPGAPPISYKQYSGYYAVGDNKEDMLHYWFVESQNNPATDPLLLWLTGGPGCSSLSTLLTVLGPVLVNPDGATLTYNPYGWNKNASLIALEAPAGVGYSYSTGNLTTGDNKTAVENWEALVAFFGEFPQYRNNDLYITGASYSGIYVPTLVKVILDRQNQFQMNLKGMAIGNGVVSSHENTDAKMQYLYNHGLVDDTQWQQAKSDCCNDNTDDCEWYKWYETAGSCYNFVDNTTDIVWNSGLDPYNLYEDCSSDGMDIKDVSKQYQVDYYHHTGEKLNPKVLGSLPCINDSDITTYLNRADVRKAIFIPTTLPAWSICNDDIAYTYYHKEIFETQDLFLAINQAGIKIMLYHGDTDLVCNVLLGSRFARKLGLPVKQAAKHFMVSGQVGGYHTIYDNNFHFVAVRGAGHTVPAQKPEVALFILNNFLFDIPF